ncbi:MAG TPA: nuclear transport factor 2 family protein, partial [Candidatus Limnocylindrales bacterium]
AWTTFDGDAWVGLFTEDAEYHEDPFSVPLTGHNALRAYLLEAAASERDVEFTVERHWVSGTTVLAAWHATFIRRPDGQHARFAGFLTAELASDGRASRFREWTVHAPATSA